MVSYLVIPGMDLIIQITNVFILKQLKKLILLRVYLSAKIVDTLRASFTYSFVINVKYFLLILVDIVHINHEWNI